MAKASKAKRSRPRAKFFLNVDLEVASKHSLSALIEALEPAAYSMERPPGRAAFELSTANTGVGPGPLIRKLARLIGNLPPAARAEWQRASKRVFDIGLRSGREPFHEGYRLDPVTLAAVQAIGAELVITIYSFQPEDDEASG